MSSYRSGPDARRLLPMGLLDYGLRPARAAVGLGARVGRGAANAAGRTALIGLDTFLGWRYTDEAVKHLLESPAADRAVGHALRGPLVDAVARDLVRYAVLERVADEVLAEDALEPLLERVLAEGVSDRLADRLLDGPQVERLAARVIESRLLDTTVERLLESEELWLLVGEIAQSPPVTDAIARQGVGFAEQVAGQVRVRSQRADAGLERVARRLLRRKPIAPDGGSETEAR